VDQPWQIANSDPQLNDKGYLLTGPVIDRLFFCAYGLAMAYVLFFENIVQCAHPECRSETYGYVEENSGTINCTECDGIIFDARDTSGTVVILELEEETAH